MKRIVQREKIIFVSIKPAIFYLLSFKRECQKCGSMYNFLEAWALVLHCSLAFIMLLFAVKNQTELAILPSFLIDGNNQPTWKENYTASTLSGMFVAHF